MSDWRELLREAAFTPRRAPDVDALRARARRRRRRNAALAVVLPTVLVGGLIGVLLTGGDGTITMIPPTTVPLTGAPVTTTAPSTTTAATVPVDTTTPRVPVESTGATTTSSTTTSTVVASGISQVSVRIVGPNGIPFAKGSTVAQACPVSGAACVYSTYLDGEGTSGLVLDAAVTYEVMAMARNTGWPNPWVSPTGIPFHFSATVTMIGADVDGTVLAVTPVPFDASTAEPVPASVCRDAIDAIGLVANGDPPDSAIAQGKWSTAAADLRLAATTAPSEVAAELEQLSSLIGGLADAVLAFEGERATTEGSIRDKIDDLREALPGYAEALAGRDVLTAIAPAFAAGCDVPSSGPTSAQDLFEFGAAVDALLQTPMAGNPRFDGLSALDGMHDHAIRGRQATSRLTTEFSECASSRSAAAVDDNRGCGALRSACADGDMPACDDLYHAAALNSQYELFAASCGNRVGTNNDYAYAGFCESLDV